MKWEEAEFGEEGSGSEGEGECGGGFVVVFEKSEADGEQSGCGAMPGNLEDKARRLQTLA